MKALFLTSGGVIASKILSAWLAGGNSVGAIWVGSKDPQRILRRDRALGIGAPSWSLSALARQYGFPVVRNPTLSSWNEVEPAISRLETDVLITAMTHQIVPQRILALFPGRAVNFHPAILPYYRGPNPRVGMVLDGTTNLYGGITVHCLAPEIDKGDIIGTRKVPYDPSRGFIYWDVCLARAAGDLVAIELAQYLKGTLKPCAQSAKLGSYRKVAREERTLLKTDSASRTKWLCDRLGAAGWVRYYSENEKKYVIYDFIRRVGSRSGKPEKIGRITIQFDTADARVSVLRGRKWTNLLQKLRYWLAIARTS